MSNFWDSDVWGSMNLIAIILFSLIVANMLKKNLKFLQATLIPTSVIGGIILLVVSNLTNLIWGTNLFETNFFSGEGSSGIDMLEIITYHALALGFIAQTLRESSRKFTKERNCEIFNSGVTTVASYLLQGALGLSITLVASMIITGFFPASGLLLTFGFGQGSGQALNYGSIYETDYGFIGGKSFGLAIAALGFISSSIGGVIHMNIMKSKGKITIRSAEEDITSPEAVESKKEIPMNGTIDKLTVQIAFIAVTYAVTYAMMYLLGSLLPGMRSVIYGFNFLLGVIAASLIKAIVNLLRKRGIVKKQYTNNFFLTHLANFFFDIMIVAGIAAIRLDTIKMYWHVLIILAALGTLVTYFYNYFVAKRLFKDYTQEQFLVMYGMLTGTASTGIMLLREVDPRFETPASENLIYQTLYAIILGFPMMMVALLAPAHTISTLVIVAVSFVVLNIVLFRKAIFKRRKPKNEGNE